MAKRYLVTDDELRAKVLAILRDMDTNPIGTIISFMGQQPPEAYLYCDGHEYLIKDYQELADFVVVNFGMVNHFGGDGERYFAVPDLRGEFLRGTGVNEHEMCGNGAAVGVHQAPTEHLNFGINAGSSNGELWIQTNKTNNENTHVLSGINGDTFRYMGDNVGITWAKSRNFEGTGNARYTSRPTNTSVLFCIKAKNG